MGACCSAPQNEFTAVPKEHVGTPIEAKAVAHLLETSNGPPPASEFNKNLKMILTSSGMMPATSQVHFDAYAAMKKTVEGKGILYLLDAKFLELQFHHMKADPEKVNDQAQVAYRRNPDAPGGEPVKEDGKLVMKTQAELFPMNKCNFVYSLRTAGHFANGHLSVLAGDEDVPVYFAYQFYEGELVDGKPDAKILFAKGYWKGGKFTAQKANGEDFAESDYESPWASEMDRNETELLKYISNEEFKKITSEVSTIWSCGGNVFLTVKAMEPCFHTKEGKVTDIHNEYGRAVLDATKEGRVVYIGASAGAVSLSFALGPLTADTGDVDVAEDDHHHNMMHLDQAGMLGDDWLFPPMHEYLGMPYRILFRPHMSFNGNLKFNAVGMAAIKVQEVINHSERAAKHDIYVVTVMDYDYKTGQGDSFQIFDGKCFYLVGKCDVELDITEEGQAAAKKAHPVWAEKSSAKVRMQPASVPEKGMVIEWKPSVGEVLAAGPDSKAPFRNYANSKGLMDNAPPN